MALNYVAAKTVSHCDSTFKIHDTSRDESSQRGETERFMHDISSESVGQNVNDSEADTVDGNGVAQGRSVHYSGTLDADAL